MPEKERLTIQIKDADNVAVAVRDLPAGTRIEAGSVTLSDIPQAHKIALRDIPAGGEIIRYGVTLGHAKADIPAGSWINEHMLTLPESPSLENLPFGTNLVKKEDLPEPPRTTWMGYRNAEGPAGTPAEVIAFYEDLVQKIHADPKGVEAIANVQMMPYYLSAADSAKHDEWIYNYIKGIADSLAN